MTFSPLPQKLDQLYKEKADFTVVAGDEGSSSAGGSSGQNEGNSGPAVSCKASGASPKIKKAGGKLSSPNNKGGKEKAEARMMKSMV